MGNARTVKARDGGNQIAEARQIGRVGLQNWALIAAMQTQEKIELLTRADFTRLSTLVDLASGARGAQLNKAGAAKKATLVERKLGVSLHAMFAKWRALFKRKFPKDRTHWETMGVGREIRATLTGVLIDHGQAMLDALTTKSKTGDELVAAKSAVAAAKAAGIDAKKLRAMQSLLDQLAEADTVQGVLKRMAAAAPPQRTRRSRR